MAVTNRKSSSTDSVVDNCSFTYINYYSSDSSSETNKYYYKIPTSSSYNYSIVYDFPPINVILPKKRIYIHIVDENRYDRLIIGESRRFYFETYFNDSDNVFDDDIEQLALILDKTHSNFDTIISIKSEDPLINFSEIPLLHYAIVNNKEESGASILIEFTNAPVTELNETRLLEEIAALVNMDLENVTIGFKLNDEGLIVGIVVYCKTIKEAQSIEEEVNKQIEKGCTDLIVCGADEVVWVTRLKLEASPTIHTSRLFIEMMLIILCMLLVNHY